MEHLVHLEGESWEAYETRHEAARVAAPRIAREHGPG
jgi:hypothetical protein